MKRNSPEVLAFVMAGGEGSRLHPLTAHRCKPSVPFDGKHRLVDFVLSNLVNSDIYSIYLLVQYKSQALIEHVRSSWALGRLFPDHFVTVVPPQMSDGPRWFQGTADAVAQNVHLIESRKPDLVAIFGADHIYRMDVRQMVDEHLRRGADVSIATLPVPLSECASFGIVETDDDMWVRDFREKPATTRGMPGRHTHALASMGNYVFSADVLVEALRSAKGSDRNDFGHHVLPALAATHKVLAYDFTTNDIPGLATHEEPHYWRDVGTIEAYFAAHFDAMGAHPRFRMTNPEWPIYASPDPFESAQIESGRIEQSVVGSGCVIAGAVLERALLRRAVTVEEGAVLSNCIVMDHSVIGRGARVSRAIIDQNNHIPPGETIGVDPQRDRERFHVSDSGIVVVPRGHFPARPQ